MRLPRNPWSHPKSLPTSAGETSTGPREAPSCTRDTCPSRPTHGGLCTLFNFPAGWESEIPLHPFLVHRPRQGSLAAGDKGLLLWAVTRACPQFRPRTLSDPFRNLSNSLTHYERLLTHGVRTRVL